MPEGAPPDKLLAAVRNFCTGGVCAISVSSDRRRFISGVAAGFGALACSSFGRLMPVSAQTTVFAKAGLIDVHHHFVPPFYLAENRDRIAASSGSQINPAWLSWTPEQAIAAMDTHGVATAVLSLTFPGVWFGDPQTAAQTARRVNEYAADLARSCPGRFGLFAAIPLPDTEGSLREIEYALGVLKADGIGLLTSYGDKWLGDAAYQAVFEELNRRKAVVFVHPTAPACCRALLPDVAPTVAEIPQDTTRAVINLLFTGTFARFRDMHFIFTHAGGNVPMVLGRMQQYAPKNIAEKAPHGIDYELKRLYYDIAGTAYRPAIAALTSLIPTTHILFGSDNPYVPLAQTSEGMMHVGFSTADLQLIGRDNALALLPRLKTAKGFDNAG
jgi:6-methylsalicylate decarboxylase